MTNYRFITPRGQDEVTLSAPYGNITIANGKIFPESDLTKSFPEYFYEIPKIIKTKPVVEKQELILESTNTTEKVETPVVEKRKAGRPKSKF